MAGPTIERFSTRSDRNGSQEHFVCSWCEDVSEPSERAAGDRANYGICPSCLAAELSRLADGRVVRAAGRSPTDAGPGGAERGGELR